MAAGYSPIPCVDIFPPMKEWQEQLNATPDQIKQWSGTFPRATNTGVLTRSVPTLDIDILNPEAAKAVEDLVRGRYEKHGKILTRFGLSPKRAIPFRTDEPFKKITVNLTAPDGSEGQKIELLADGQQLVVAGIHPDTHKPYSWFGGELDETPRELLPYIREVGARDLVADVVDLLIRDFGYTLTAERPRDRTRKDQANGHDDTAEGSVADWAYLKANIRAGRELHANTRNLIAKYMTGGMGEGTAVNAVRAEMELCTAPHDAHWQERYDDIPRSASEWTAKGNTKRLSGITVKELKAMAFDPVQFLVRNLIPNEGVTLICAKPKAGKSWLVLDLALAATMNGVTLGDIKPLQGSVLYLALEDSLRRLRSRVDKLLPPSITEWPSTLTLFTEWRRVDQGGLDDIRNWVNTERAEGRTVAFVAVDVLKIVRPASIKGKPAYESDYDALTGLQKLARELTIAILVVHHTRKADSDDLLDKVSGTFGLTGAADTILVMEKKGASWIFDVRGRDVSSDELAAEFSKETCRWSILGNAAEVHRSTERDSILDVFKRAQALTSEKVTLSPKEVTEALEGDTPTSHQAVRQNMSRMAQNGLLKRDGRGKYSLAP
jgi:hypothetical protein